MLEKHPALDAERMGSNELLDHFCLPPGFNSSSTRSALLVGARGSGKTMVLRWLRHKSPGLAIYGDLRKIINPVSNDTGIGGLAWEGISPNLEVSATAKTITCLALWFAKECNKRKIEIPKSKFLMTLPRVLRDSSMNLDELFEEFCYTGLEHFSQGPTSQALLDLFHEVHNTFLPDGLHILLDRSEDVPYLSLGVLISLLDQSNAFQTLLACRPGLINMKNISTNFSIPGDHFDIVHLGADPYTTNWKQFQKKTLTSWLPETMKIIPNDYKLLTGNLSRDCLRSALKIAHSSIDNKNRFSEEAFKNAVYNLQDVLIGAFQGHVRNYNKDVRQFLKQIRKDKCVGGCLKLPVLLRNQEQHQPLLFQLPKPFGELTRTDQFIYLALRAGFFTTRDGVQWHPNKPYDEFELNPIMIWRERDIWYNIQNIS